MESFLGFLIFVTVAFSVFTLVLITVFWERFVVFLLRRFARGAWASYMLMLGFTVFFFTEAVEEFFDAASLEAVFNGVSVVLILSSQIVLLSIFFRGRTQS